jgi:hypothetical protein
LSEDQILRASAVSFTLEHLLKSELHPPLELCGESERDALTKLLIERAQLVKEIGRLEVKEIARLGERAPFSPMNLTRDPCKYRAELRLMKLGLSAAELGDQLISRLCEPRGGEV